jgi:hypothetical protein
LVAVKGNVKLNVLPFPSSDEQFKNLKQGGRICLRDSRLLKNSLSDSSFASRLTSLSAAEADASIPCERRIVKVNRKEGQQDNAFLY